MRRMLIPVLVVLFAVSILAQYTTSVEVSLYRGSTKVGTYPSWAACDAASLVLKAQYAGSEVKCQNEIHRAVASPAPPPPPPPPPPPACSDGRDNDGDGLIDLADPGCTSATDNDETNTAPPPPPPPPPSGVLFSDGWDRSTTLACNVDSILDAGAWDDAGGASLCPSNEAGIDTTVVHDGTRSLRVTQYPGNQNGTDIRIVKVLGSQSSVTLTGFVRYAPNYRWAGGDHKVFIFMDGAQTAQNVYVNYRGGSDPQHARVCIGVIPVDTIYCAANPQVTVGKWYRLRVYLKAGSAGTVQVWLREDGQVEVPLNLVWDAGNQVNWTSFNTGSLGAFKIDTTYNIGSFITEPMNQWYDQIAVYPGLVAP